MCLIASVSPLWASFFHAPTYNALGGDAANDDLARAREVLSGSITLSETGTYRAVVQCGNGSAVWIGNSETKSYFVTAAHVTNAATNVLRTYSGGVILPASGSVFHTAFNDFGLLEFNRVIDPSFFGGENPVLMDLNIVDNFLGEESTLVGYGNLTIDGRGLGRTRALSTGIITLENSERTRSDVSRNFIPSQPFAGSATGGDSGGGVFLTVDGQQVLIGAVSSGNTVLYNYAHLFAHRELIDSVVPEGVLTWYSDTLIPRSYPDQVVEVGTELNLLLDGGVILEGPAGATIDSATGRFLWTPGAEVAGMSFPVTVAPAGVSDPSPMELLSFTIQVLEVGVDLWEWSAAPEGWTGVTALNSGGSPYRLANTFPFLQGNENTLITQQVSGTIPANTTVRISLKAVDFHQTWSQGGPLEVGFLESLPTPTTAGVPFLHSEEILVPNYNGVAFTDGFTNVNQNVRYYLEFQTTAEITGPWFTVRKGEDGDRFAIDDVEITLLPPATGSGSVAYDYWAALNGVNGLPEEDHDGDGEANVLEFILGADPTDPSRRVTCHFNFTEGSSTLRYDQNLASLNDYTVTPLWSTNLVDWFEGGFIIQQVEQNDTARTLEASINTDADESRLFLKLEIEQVE